MDWHGGRLNHALRFAQGRATRRILSLQLASVNGQAILAVAEAAVGFAVDRVVHHVDRTIAERHEEAGVVGAAEGVQVNNPGAILHRRANPVAVGPAVDVVVIAKDPALIVASHSSVLVVIGTQEAFADEVRVARTVGDVGDGHWLRRKITPVSSHPNCFGCNPILR